jgi:hypothetical protein
MIGHEALLPADDRARLVRIFVEGRLAGVCRKRRRVERVSPYCENRGFGRFNPRGLATRGRTT